MSSVYEGMTDAEKKAACYLKELNLWWIEPLREKPSESFSFVSKPLFSYAESTSRSVI